MRTPVVFLALALMQVFPHGWPFVQCLQLTRERWFRTEMRWLSTAKRRNFSSFYDLTPTVAFPQDD